MTDDRDRDPMLPEVPQPGDSRTHDPNGPDTLTVLQSFMVTAGVSSPEDPAVPGTPVVVLDLVLVDAFAPQAGAEPIRILVEHSDRSTRAFLAGIAHAIELLDALADPKQ